MGIARALLLSFGLALLGCPVAGGDDDDSGDGSTANDDDAVDDDDVAGDDDDAANDDDAADDDDATDDDDDDGLVCTGDALTPAVPYSADMDAFEDRWNENSELLRILFVGEPL